MRHRVVKSRQNRVEIGRYRRDKEPDQDHRPSEICIRPALCAAEPDIRINEKSQREKDKSGKKCLTKIRRERLPERAECTEFPIAPKDFEHHGIKRSKARPDCHDRDRRHGEQNTRYDQNADADHKLTERAVIAEKSGNLFTHCASPSRK